MWNIILICNIIILLLIDVVVLWLIFISIDINLLLLLLLLLLVRLLRKRIDRLRRVGFRFLGSVDGVHRLFNGGISGWLVVGVV